MHGVQSGQVVGESIECGGKIHLLDTYPKSDDSRCSMCNSVMSGFDLVIMLRPCTTAWISSQIKLIFLPVWPEFFREGLDILCYRLKFQRGDWFGLIALVSKVTCFQNSRSSQQEIES